MTKLFEDYLIHSKWNFSCSECQPMKSTFQDISQLKIIFYLGGIMGDGYMSLELVNMILKNYCNCVGMAGVRGAFEGVPYLRIV